MNEFGKQFVDDKAVSCGEISERAGVFHFRDAYQRDFQARLDWCVSEYDDANHPPVAMISVEKDTLMPGESLILDGSRSTDPDGDGLNYRWWIDEGACSESVKAELSVVEISDECGNNCSTLAKLNVLSGSGEGQIHVILEVTDHGTPALTRYCRKMIKVIF